MSAVTSPFNVSLDSWKCNLDEIDNEVNQLHEASEISAVGVEKICADIETKLSEIQNIWDKAKKELDKLNENGYDPTSKPYWKITGGDVFAYLVTAAGASCLSTENTRIAGYVLTSVAAAAYFGIKIYSTRFDVKADEREKLNMLNNRTEVARTFKQFLLELKAILKAPPGSVSNEPLRRSDATDADDVVRHSSSNLSFTEEQISSLDASIGRCLKSYEHLPHHKRKEETYCKIVSELIKRLPPEDPVNKAFMELFPQPPPAAKWKSEAAPLLQNTSHLDLRDSSSSRADASNTSYKSVADMVAKRFGCQNPSFFQHGLRLVNAEGMTIVVPLLAERRDSSDDPLTTRETQPY